ncbi:MAG: hypothetical protein WD766_04570 [Gemmatimonadota bacterium]
MIWFGNLNRILASPAPEHLRLAAAETRMQFALERVAEAAPGIGGQFLLDALAATGWVDRSTAERLLPHFRHFDPDRHFGDYLRRLSFRGRSSGDEFRSGIRCIVEEITGTGWIGEIGSEPCVRFSTRGVEGLVLAEPEVGFTIAGRTRDALAAAVEEMPDVVVVIARNFDRHAAEQLSGILYRTGVPATLVTLNLLLGIRATALRYQPPTTRVIDVLATGGALRSADIAQLGERELAA